MHSVDPPLTGPDARAIARAVASGETTPEAVVAAAIERTERCEPSLQTYTHWDGAGALAQAREVARRLKAGESLPLAGVPISVKDQTWVRDMPCTGGSRIFADFIPERDATCVARLRAAGAVIMGKTVTAEFGVFWRAGAQVGGETRNPWDLSRTPGGSSAGSAAGVAAGLVAASVGADGGGSIRLPSAFCGIVGLHPTLARIPRSGGFDGAKLFTQFGPMARSVGDVALMHQIMAGPDPDDPYSLDLPPALPAPADPGAVRLAFWDRPGRMAQDHDPEVLELVRDAAARLAGSMDRLAPSPDEIDTDAILPHFRVISGADRLGHLGQALLDDPERAAKLGPYAREAFRAAQAITGADYARALDHRQRFIVALKALFQRVDIVLSPTAGTTALPIPDNPTWRPPGYFAYTFVANYTGFPALSVPCGLVRGLPVGLQLMGPPGSEAMLFQIGARAERLFGRFTPPEI